MMYSFLYLIEPDVLAWLVQTKYAQEQDKGKAWFRSLLEILVYSSVNMAITVYMLLPMDLVWIVPLANGLPAVPGI